MFRLMEMALNRHATREGIDSIRYFFGQHADEGVARLLRAADAAGVSTEARAAIPASGHWWTETTDILVVESARISGDDITRAPQRPSLIQKFGEVLDNIDTDAARSLGIPVVPMRRRTMISCAEHVLGLMLALGRRLLVAHDGVASTARPAPQPELAGGGSSVRFNWGDVSGIQVLDGRTLGLVGFGEVGRAVAVRAQALGMTVLYHRRTAAGTGWLPRALRDARQVELEELLSCSDVVSIHVPENEATMGMIDRSALSTMRSSAWLINISRGSIVDEKVLERALRDGELAGAALDVHHREPLPTDSGLIGVDNVVMTPHIASGGVDYVMREVDDLLGRVAAFEHRSGDQEGQRS